MGQRAHPSLLGPWVSNDTWLVSCSCFPWDAFGPTQRMCSAAKLLLYTAAVCGEREQAGDGGQGNLHRCGVEPPPSLDGSSSEGQIKS